MRKPYFKMLTIRLKENILLREIILRLLYILGIIEYTLKLNQKAFCLFCKIHRITRQKSLKLKIEKYIKILLSFSYITYPSLKSSKKILSNIGTRILTLKQSTPDEKGVLFIMFSECLSIIRDGMDVQLLLQDYILIFEPSWSGYCDPDLLYFTQFPEPVFVLSAEKSDYDFLSRLNTNLIPLHLGPCDWVNPIIAKKYLKNKKSFDIVMNSNWGSAKRHHILFSALAKIPIKLKVVLIGGPWEGRTSKDILQMASYYGVENQLTIFESIPYTEVMNIMSSSHISLLLSRKEGSNRALAESIFCNVPVLLINEHVGGIRKNIVTETGWIVPENKLDIHILEKLQLCKKMTPRKWGVENISYIKSTEKLNNYLKTYLLKHNINYSRGICQHSNSPDTTYECSDDILEKLQTENDLLSQYVNN